MKKHMLILPSLLLVSVLAACGSHTLTEAQAVEVAKKIQAKHAETSFAYPQDKLTLTLTSVENGESEKVDSRSIKNTYYYTYGTASTPATSTSAAQSSSETLYLYSKDGKYISAADDGTNKYYSELNSADFATEIASAQETFYKIADLTAEGFYSSLDDFIASKSASSSSSSSAKTSESSVKTTYTYSSKGDGNLTLKANQSEDDSEGKATGEETITFDNYLPVSVASSSKGQKIIASSATSIDESGEYTLSWNTCEAIYPDLTKFTKK